MNKTELIEIARECFDDVEQDEQFPWQATNKGLQKFAQRIEQPLLDRIVELANTANANLNAKDKQIEQLREDLEDALRYKRADEKLVDIINGMGQQQQKPKHGRQA